MSNKGTLHVDTPLTNYSLMYKNGGFVADQVMPKLDVKKDTDEYWIYDRGGYNTAKNVVRTATGKVARINALKYSTGTYKTLEYAFFDYIADTERENVDKPISLDFDMAETLTAIQMLMHEKRVATICTAASTFATSGNTVTLSGTEQWNDASFDPDSATDAIEVRVDTGKEAIRGVIGTDPNTIVIPAAVARVMKRDSQIRELIKYTNNTLLVNGDLPPTLWNMRVLIPGAIENTAAENLTFSGSDIWGKHVFMAYVEPPKLKSMGFGATITSMDNQITKWRDDPRYSDAVAIRKKCTEKIFNEYAGYLIRNAIA